MTESTPDAYPDIEIYLKRIEAPAIIAWLKTLFEGVDSQTRGIATVCHIKPWMECVITERVTKGGYTSLWFKTNQTPWKTDQDCASAAFDHFKVEIRCSLGGWSGERSGDEAVEEGGEDEDKGQWLRITNKGIQTVNWFE